jgi:hypothetical protein
VTTGIWALMQWGTATALQRLSTLRLLQTAHLEVGALQISTQEGWPQRHGSLHLDHVWLYTGRGGQATVLPRGHVLMSMQHWLQHFCQGRTIVPCNSIDESKTGQC